MRMKLTVRSVEAIEPGEKDIVAYDTDVPGFGLKVTPKGLRTYFFYYRTREKLQRRPTIGPHGPFRPEFAREIARRWCAEVKQGGDPSQERAHQTVAPTVRELCTRYLEEYAGPRKKQSSIRNDVRLIEARIIPAIGSRKVASVTRAEIASLHHALRKTPYEANRMLALASKMFGLSERWGMRPDATNPAKNIDRFSEEKRERYLSEDELARLWRVLDSHEAQACVSESAIAAIKLLSLTGRRLGEVLGLKWRWVDLKVRTMRFPDTKTGSLLVSLGEPTVRLLTELRERASDDSEFVIEGQRRGRPLVNLQKPWRTIRDMAELEGVRIHDLRHTYASIAAGLGMSLPLIGRLLGHSQAATTSRYAHLAQNPVRLAADAINEAVEKSIRNSSSESSIKKPVPRTLPRRGNN